MNNKKEFKEQNVLIFKKKNFSEKLNNRQKVQTSGPPPHSFLGSNKGKSTQILVPNLRTESCLSEPEL